MQLMPKKVTLQLTSAARQFLLKKGYDRAYGARPMARAIDEWLKKPLVDELLFGALSQGGEVFADCATGGEKLLITTKPLVLALGSLDKTKTEPIM
jgi:ATP-dependent Clp protease ATP-binding subunit ClpA